MLLSPVKNWNSLTFRGFKTSEASFSLLFVIRTDCMFLPENTWLGWLEPRPDFGEAVIYLKLGREVKTWFYSFTGFFRSGEDPTELIFWDSVMDWGTKSSCDNTSLSVANYLVIMGIPPLSFNVSTFSWLKYKFWFRSNKSSLNLWCCFMKPLIFCSIFSILYCRFGCYFIYFFCWIMSFGSYWTIGSYNNCL